MDSSAFENAKRAVIRVGDGCGFVVEGSKDRLLCVITAAHCLPHLPLPNPAPPIEERFYENLLGRIGDSPTAGAECLFVDPIADIAVLGDPGGKSFIPKPITT